MSRAWCLVLLALGACYAPDLSRVAYSCSAEHPYCPEGQRCIDGCCGGGACGSLPMPLPTADGALVIDGGTAAGSDMAAGNPYAWNPSQPAGPAPGCANNRGWQLGSTKLYACPGKINYGTYPGLCAAGYSPPAVLTIPESACSSVPWGFFASAAHGLDRQTTPTAQMRSDWNAPDASYDVAYRFGCGQQSRIWQYPPNPARGYTFTSSVKVAGYSIAALCSGPKAGIADTPWNCDATQYPYREAEFPKATALLSDADGLLCASP